MIITLDNKSPLIGYKVYIADGTYLIGAVEIGDYSSIWFNSVLRGDINSIVVGRETNIQDNCVIHVDSGDNCSVNIGNNVTIGHSVVVHGSNIGDRVLVGMGSIIMNNVIIGSDTVVGAGSLLPNNKVYPARSLIMGRPGRVIRQLNQEEIDNILLSSKRYIKYAKKYV